ncbi:hypothetical protein EYF80_005030 [Liparis tanakae]|uniref:Uncharacterized protein n=1 Tax=Liparis tanakae TaxID=230148 RepID=A0A4Z2J2P0_9TELE|nr:hypothetical protein EYF80_005030 [Liparis tanakae]
MKGRGLQQVFSLTAEVQIQQVMQDAGGCWRMLEDAGGCWRMLEDAGGCWRMLEDAVRVEDS